MVPIELDSTTILLVSFSTYTSCKIVLILFLANQSKIYEATVEFGRDYLDGNVSPCKPLPMPHSVDAYYSDIGMNMQGGYEKLLKEMNIPSDPSSIQALLQLSAHIANQNLAHKHSSHSNNRYNLNQSNLTLLNIPFLFQVSRRSWTLLWRREYQTLPLYLPPQCH